MTVNLSNEQIDIYKEYRTAKRNLKKGRDFADWWKVMRGYDQARREAQQRAGGINRPQGARYREEFARIDRREKLIDRGVDEDGKPWEFPTPEDRTYCIKVLENYDAPSEDPRRPSIKVWRDRLTPGKRAGLNHPKRVWTAYWADTKPRAEREAEQASREARAQAKEDPLLEDLANTEVREHDARRQVEALRELLALIRDAVDLPEDIAAKIDAVLAG
jgi:hypothetical protein